MSKPLYLLKVKKSYGKKGEVLAKLLLEDTELLKKNSSLYFLYKGEERNLTIESIRRRGGKSYIVKFKEINSKEKADSLKDIVFYLNLEELPEEEKDKFLDELIVDYDVIDKNMGKVGKVLRVEKSKFQKRLVIIDKDENTFYVPFVDEFVKKIDKKGKRILTDCEKILKL